MAERIDAARELFTPKRGWLLIGAYVVAHDVMCKEGNTLSEGFDRALERPIGKAIAVGGTAMVAAHLCNMLPEKIDPIHLALKWKNIRDDVIDDLL